MKGNMERIHKYKCDVSLGDMYKKYLEHNPKDSDFYVTYSSYKLIYNSFINKVKQSMLEDNSDFNMPYRLGMIRIVKSKVNLDKPRIDFNLTKQYGKTVYFLNTHSKGYKYRFKWNKQTCIVPNKSVYSFIPCRKFARSLAAYIKNGYDYSRI